MSECDPETYYNANNNCLHQEGFGQCHKQLRTRTVIQFESMPDTKGK